MSYKFKKNDVVVLVNPTDAWCEADAEILHGEIGVVQDDDGYLCTVKHKGSLDRSVLDFVCCADQMEKIGVL